MSASRAWPPTREWTLRIPRAVQRWRLEGRETQGFGPLLDGAILGGLSAKESQRAVRKRLRMRSCSKASNSVGAVDGRIWCAGVSERAARLPATSVPARWLPKSAPLTAEGQQPFESQSAPGAGEQSPARGVETPPPGVHRREPAEYSRRAAWSRTRAGRLRRQPSWTQSRSRCELTDRPATLLQNRGQAERQTCAERWTVPSAHRCLRRCEGSHRPEPNASVQRSPQRLRCNQRRAESEPRRQGYRPGHGLRCSTQV